MPNTVTSPQQTGVRDILRAVTANAPSTKDIAIFNTPSVRALMKGLTDAKSEGDAKSKAEEIAAAPTPEITTKTKVDKATGQAVHDITITNFQPGNEQDEVQKAYDLPQEQLDRWRDQAANDYHLKRPGGADLAENQKSLIGRYKLERESGEGRIKSFVKAAVITALPDRQEKSVTENVANAVDRKRKQEADAYITQDLPLIREADAQRRLENADATTKRTEGKALRAGLDKTVSQTDWTLIPEEDRYAHAAAENGNSIAQMPDAYKARIDRQARQQKEKQRLDRLKSFRTESGLGTFATIGDAKKALGDPNLSRDEESQLAADWKAKRTAFVDQQRAQERADRRIEMAVTAANKPEKPRRLRAFDAESASVDALVSTRGDDAFDQTSVRQAIEARGGKIEQRLAELDAKMKGNAAAHDKLSKVVYDKEGKLTTAAQLNPWLMQQVIAREGDGVRWAQEAETLKGDLAKVKRANAIEQGIDAYMKAAGIKDRKTAVEQLRAAGKPVD